MNPIQGTLLALIQGITEFLPISSSAHLFLASQYLGYRDQGLLFDVILHFGTLLAVLVYFRKDMLRIFVLPFLPLSNAVRNSRSSTYTALPNANARQPAILIALATIPAGLTGLLAGNWIEQNLRSDLVIALATIFFGLFLGLADARAKKSAAAGTQPQTLEGLGWPIALAIGVFQVLAFIPGTSRSGITIAAALLFGLSRSDSLRFSYYLSIPLLFFASIFGVGKLFSTPFIDNQNLIGSYLLPFCIAMGSAWLTIHFLLRWVNRLGFHFFVFYRILLGTFILWNLL